MQFRDGKSFYSFPDVAGSTCKLEYPRNSSILASGAFEIEVYAGNSPTFASDAFEIEDAGNSPVFACYTYRIE